MKIARTLGEINARHDWNRFCEVTGLNPWCMNEGLANSDEVVPLTVDEAKRRCGIRPRTYVQLSRAWYGKLILERYAKDAVPTVDTISIMVRDLEFMISWKELGGEDCPHLEVFDEAWGILVNDCADLLKELALLADATPSPDRIVEVLDRLGFKDETQEKEES